MNLQIINTGLPLLFLAYQIMIDFVNLYPFNDIHSRDKRLRKIEVFGNYPPLLVIAICFYFHHPVSMGLGLSDNYYFDYAPLFLVASLLYRLPEIC